jgi:glycine cleavage system aminomethyltransferase T
MDLKYVPLNDLHANLGGKMVPFAGFNMPVRYSSDLEEHMTVRNGVGVFDVSHMGEFTLKDRMPLTLFSVLPATTLLNWSMAKHNTPVFQTKPGDWLMIL